jgi:BMFP domain-containing protein YqiC
MSLITDRDFDVRAYPTLTETAQLLDVNKSTVSKRAQRSESANGTRRLPPAEVLRLGREQRKVPLTQLAHTLVQYAERHAPAHRAEVERQVQEFFAADREREKLQVSREEFLAQARVLLDDHAYAELEHRYDQTYGHRPATPLVSTFEGVDA